MADLPTLALGTFSNVSGTQIQGSNPVLEIIASADDADYVFAATNTTHNANADFTLDDMPADFGRMLTLSIRLRYVQSGLSNNTWDLLQAHVRSSSSGTLYTDNVTVASNITTTTPQNSSSTAFTDPAGGGGAGDWTLLTSTDWNAANIRLSWTITRNKGGDTYQARVTAAELTGTYSIAAASSGHGPLLAGKRNFTVRLF